MKTATIAAILFLYPVMGFAPSRAPCVASTAQQSKIDKMREEIVHELEGLGEEIKPQLRNENAKGFEYTESLIHKLRHELHERDLKYLKEIKHLRKEVEVLTVLLKTEDIVEDALEAKIHDYEDENESVFRLLGEAVKLVGRRTGNGANSVLRFLRLKKKEA